MVRVIEERGQARLPDPETLELDAFPQGDSSQRALALRSGGAPYL